MPTKQEILANPAIKGVIDVGHRVEDDVYTWSQGLAFHHMNLREGLNAEVSDPSVRRAIQTDIWRFFYSVGMERPNTVLGLSAEPNLAAIDQTLTAILSDRSHPAILGMGDYVEEAFVNWVRSFAIYDYAAYTFLERHLGAKDALHVYMGLWEKFSLSALDHVKAQVGIQSPADATMPALGKLSRIYWESIDTPYRVTRDTEDVHEAEILLCGYWENMKTLLGEGPARAMTLKTEAITSCNYYDAVLKALGVFDRYTFTMDKFACCGDDCCRIRFERR